MTRLEHRSARRGVLRVLTYHRIDTPESRPFDYPGLISATPTQFRTQMEFLAGAYNVLSLQDVLAAMEHDTPLPANGVLVTFDDATIDFADHAWPILKSLGLPATVFVPTAYPDDPSRHFWWNRLYRAVCLSPTGRQLPSIHGSVRLSSETQRAQIFREWKERFKTVSNAEFQQQLQEIISAADVPDPVNNSVMSWQTLREMHRDGVTLAPHTHTHPMLNRISRAEIREELVTSRDRLSQELGCSVASVLAYPAGGVNEDVTAAMAETGYQLGFTTVRGVNSQVGKSPYRLRRINVSSNTTLGYLRLQLANWGT